MEKLKYILVPIFIVYVFVIRAQPVQVHFEGTVYDESNAVIREAQVVVSRGQTVFNLIKADENGNYNVYLPLNGDYNITVSKAGYVQKKYSVSTRNIPADKSQIAFATNVADVVLFTFYEGIDYSLFEKPMNLYAYNPEKDNILYDEEYLKGIKAELKEFRKMEKEALKLAKEKAKANEEQMAIEKANSEKLKAEKVKADQRLAYEKAQVERIERENAGNPVTGNISLEQKPDKLVVTSSMVITKNETDKRTAALLAKYKPGVTEEVFQGEGVYIIQRVLVRNEMVWIYQKKIFSWGGVACFRDKQAITEGTFESETRKS
jgi:hypothetical protein